MTTALVVVFALSSVSAAPSYEDAKVTEGKYNYPKAIRTGSCASVSGLDHAYGDAKVIKNVSTAAECCQLCTEYGPSCIGWVLEVDTLQYCFLKSTASSNPCQGVAPCTRKLANRISSASLPPLRPTPAPPPPAPAPTPKHWLPVQKLSAPYRNWRYLIFISPIFTPIT